MALSAQQLTYLKTCDQRFKASVALFPAYSPTITTPTPGAGTLLNHKPIPMVSPRYSVVDNSGSITLYATDSYNRGGEYVGNSNIAWANTGGSGTLVDNADGTATYTAPASGSGTNLITMTASNDYGDKDAKVYVAYPKSAYDAIAAEIASMSGSVEQKGWTVTLRVRGDTSAFEIGKIVLLHIDDTWSGTTSTFGGYKYAEGVFCGYITDMQYFESWDGQRWLGIEAQSSWWKLDQIQIAETYWGRTKATGRYYRSDFVPVDAAWKFVNDITDFTSRHNVTLFYDTNVIDDLIIGKSADGYTSLATIIEDLMGRGLAIAYTDRYSSLMCIPDPDVRSAEWWGTPEPMFDSSGDGALTEQFCFSYEIQRHHTPNVKKLSLIAYDSSKLGLWAVSQASAGSPGSESAIKGLLCDDVLQLVAWAKEKRAQMNKPWHIRADIPLNHVVDICSPVDVDFTNPLLAGGLTAAGLAWVESISYRPTTDGKWRGQWVLAKNTQSDTGLSGEITGWGGTGQWGSRSGITGIDLENTGGWTAPSQGSSTWYHLFNFINSGYGGWSAQTDINYHTSGYAGSYQSGYGWSAMRVWSTDDNRWDWWIDIYQPISPRTITGMRFWISAGGGDSLGFIVHSEQDMVDTSGINFVQTSPLTPGVSIQSAATSYENVSGLTIGFACYEPPSAVDGPRIYSAAFGGYGADPFSG
jgi:hypothetical protein